MCCEGLAGKLTVMLSCLASAGIMFSYLFTLCLRKCILHAVD